jgi:serine/threonine protein kinase
MKQYECLALLGKGYNWQVFLARDVKTARLYAVKERQKQKIIEFDEMLSVRREMETLQLFSEEKHPFLIRLIDVFHTQQAIYFVTDFVSGGDLGYLLERQPLRPEQARIYAVELCLAVKYLHERDIIHRNIRLDNTLIVDDDRLVLGGFGSCKGTSTTSSFVGGGDVMPPEVLLDQGYGRPVDWWALGVVLYHMLQRQCPFSGETADELYDAILTEEPQYPNTLPRTSADILRRLLERDPRQRLGSSEAGAAEVMQHAYFSDVDWHDVAQSPVEAPCKSLEDIGTVLGNFREEYTHQSRLLDFRNLTSSAERANNFHDFGFPQ